MPFSGRNIPQDPGDPATARSSFPADLRALEPSLPRIGRTPPSPVSLRWNTVCHVLISLLLCAALALHLVHHPLTLIETGLIAFAALLLCLLRLTPLHGFGERVVTFTVPVTFSLLLWLGALPAALGALTACALQSRFGSIRSLSARLATRSLGVQLALAALLAGQAQRLLQSTLHTAPPATLRSLLTPLDRPLRLLACAALTACVFYAAVGALTLIVRAGRWRTLWRMTRQRERMRAVTLVYGLGTLPTLLLAPFGPTLGLLIALPLYLFLLLGAQVARLSLEIRAVRGQLHTAEAMGRAGIGDAACDLSTATLLQRFLTLAEGMVASERALVWCLDGDTGEMTPMAGLPDMGVFVGERIPYGDGLIGDAAGRTRPRLIADAARDPRRGRSDMGSGAWLLYPLYVHHRILGVAHWIRPVNQPFTEEDVVRLDALIPQAAIALENVRVREQMHDLADTDGLTGLWNQRRMYALLREETKRAGRYHRPLCVMMMDVDSFKTFNDTYGHPQGDVLLRTIAGILSEGVRNVDFVGRYGGEEFMVILPETTKDAACQLAERIRSSVEAQAMVMIDDAPVRRTVSVGVAAYPEDALNANDLVQRADEALYRAKRAGKNCVIWA